MGRMTMKSTRIEYWAIHSSARSFARTAHSLALGKEVHVECVAFVFEINAPFSCNCGAEFDACSARTFYACLTAFFVIRAFVAVSLIISFSIPFVPSPRAIQYHIGLFLSF